MRVRGCVCVCLCVHISMDSVLSHLEKLTEKFH